MKYLSIILLILYPIFLTAQEVTKDIYQFMKADDVEAFEKYIHAGNDINQCLTLKESKYSLLTLAIKSNSVKIFDKCIALEANLELICTDKSPLMYTIKNDRSDMLIALLSADVDRHQKSNQGRTAMEYAIKYDKPHLAKLLK